MGVSRRGRATAVGLFTCTVLLRSAHHTIGRLSRHLLPWTLAGCRFVCVAVLTLDNTPPGANSKFSDQRLAWFRGYSCSSQLFPFYFTKLLIIGHVCLETLLLPQQEEVRCEYMVMPFGGQTCANALSRQSECYKLLTCRNAKPARATLSARCCATWLWLVIVACSRQDSSILCAGIGSVIMSPSIARRCIHGCTRTYQRS